MEEMCSHSLQARMLHYFEDLYRGRVLQSELVEVSTSEDYKLLFN